MRILIWECVHPYESVCTNMRVCALYESAYTVCTHMRVCIPTHMRVCALIWKCVYSYESVYMRVCALIWECVHSYESVYTHMRVCILIWECVSSYESVYPHMRVRILIWECVSSFRITYAVYNKYIWNTHSLARARALSLLLSRPLVLSLSRSLSRIHTLIWTTLPRRWGLGGGFFRWICESETASEREKVQERERVEGGFFFGFPCAVLLFLIKGGPLAPASSKHSLYRAVLWRGGSKGTPFD